MNDSASHHRFVEDTFNEIWMLIFLSIWPYYKINVTKLRQNWNLKIIEGESGRHDIIYKFNISVWHFKIMYTPEHLNLMA